MARARSSVNMYLNIKVYSRAKLALEALDSSVSEYVDDYLKLTLPMLEVAAKTKDFRAVGSAIGVQVAELMQSNMRIIEGGDNPKKLKKKVIKK